MTQIIEKTRDATENDSELKNLVDDDPHNIMKKQFFAYLLKKYTQDVRFRLYLVFIYILWDIRRHNSSKLTYFSTQKTEKTRNFEVVL